MKQLLKAKLPEVVDRFAEALVQLTPEELGRMLGVGVPRHPRRTRLGLAVLSPRERAVYDLVVYGRLNSREIARALKIHEGTVATHKHRINAKLRKAPELVARAARGGLL
jgi:DNA-binding CsgD family transcriptional regulator